MVQRARAHIRRPRSKHRRSVHLPSPHTRIHIQQLCTHACRQVLILRHLLVLIHLPDPACRCLRSVLRNTGEHSDTKGMKASTTAAALHQSEQVTWRHASQCPSQCSMQPEAQGMAGGRALTLAPMRLCAAGAWVLRRLQARLQCAPWAYAS